ncbi:MAG: Crp/Fnr family transcriptional regulator [Bdellovibrionia bacterium]
MNIAQYFLKGRRKEYRRGDHVYQTDESPLGLYMVEKGLVGLIIVGEKGHDHLVRLFKPGQIFGHRSLFAKERYHATATVLEDTVISFIAKEDLRSIMQGNCEFSEYLLENMAKEMRLAEQKQIALSEKNVTARIAESLVYLKEMYPSHMWTRQEIADFCGSTAATVIRTLAKFEEQGFIEQTGRDIKILNKSELLSLEP